MSHVTLEQRYVISRMLSKNKKLDEIGIAIGKDKSVVSREIMRNCDQRTGKYKPELAHKKYQSRLHSKPKRVKLTEPVKEYIEKKIEDQWSPEQISNRPNSEGLDLVSPETIYKYTALYIKRGGG
ncbi:MAG: IS30 family transposase [Bacteroidetes bacterium]|nr:IS30 family transposase [Bacteroidota bacterium]